MDVPLSRARRQQRTRRRWLWAAAAALPIAGGAWLVAQLGPQLERVERAGIWTGTVERSPLVVRVRGAGTLRPESIRWLTAESSGRVEEVLVKPGAAVEPATGVVRLENLDLELQAVQAQREVQGAQAQVLALERQQEQAQLDLAAELANLRALLGDARRRAQAFAESDGEIGSRLDGARAADTAVELGQREQLAERRARLLAQSSPRELETLRQQVLAASRARDVRRQLVDRLLVRAAAHGILQDVLVELGQWVVPGTAVAKVIVDRQLEAELRVPAEQAGAIAVGQRALISTGFGDARDSSITGQVRRVAPAASQGSVLVEIALTGALPENARPDQNVDGTIETERTEPTLHVARPVGLGSGNTSSLFRLDPVTGIATRVEVRTGRVSVDRVEVLSGLAAGDEVILSETSRYSHASQLRVE